MRYQDPGAALTAVEQGKADVMVGQPPPARFSELSSRYATLAHPVAATFHRYISLNTAVPPFTSLAARQALNFAVDRAAMARTMGGRRRPCPRARCCRPGCSGTRPTARPREVGRRAAPGQAPTSRARGSWSPSRGPRAIGWWCGHGAAPTPPLLVPAIVRALNQLGYRASSHVTPATGAGYGEWNAASSDSRQTRLRGAHRLDCRLPESDRFLRRPALLPRLRAARPEKPQHVGVVRSHAGRLIHRAEARQVRDPAGGPRCGRPPIAAPSISLLGAPAHTPSRPMSCPTTPRTTSTTRSGRCCSTSSGCGDDVSTVPVRRDADLTADLTSGHRFDMRRCL